MNEVDLSTVSNEDLLEELEKRCEPCFIAFMTRKCKNSEDGSTENMVWKGGDMITMLGLMEKEKHVILRQLG